MEVGKSIPSDGFIAAVSREFRVSYSWLRTGEANERDPVDDRLIEWLRRNPEVARELRIRGGLDKWFDISNLPCYNKIVRTPQGSSTTGEWYGSICII